MQKIFNKDQNQIIQYHEIQDYFWRTGKDLHEISQTQQHDSSNYAQMQSKHFEKLVKKCLKVKHLEYEDKAIYKNTSSNCH